MGRKSLEQYWSTSDVNDVCIYLHRIDFVSYFVVHCCINPKILLSACFTPTVKEKYLPSLYMSTSAKAQPGSVNQISRALLAAPGDKIVFSGRCHQDVIA